MKRIALIFTLALFVGCKKETFTIQNNNGNQIFILGHGGMGFSNLYPINSLESISNCLNIGATGSEMDVQMTKDSVLVAFHDSNLSPSTDMIGIVNSMTWEEIQNANYLNAPYSPYSLVRLEDIFTSITDYSNYIFTFDIKLYGATTDFDGYYDTFSSALVKFYDKFGLHSNVYIESQNITFLGVIRAKAPSLRVYYYPQTFDDGLNIALEYGVQGITISNEVIDVDQVALAHQYGLFVTIWGVNTKEKNKDAIRKNPDMIQTDNVQYLVDLLH